MKPTVWIQAGGKKLMRVLFPVVFSLMAIVTPAFGTSVWMIDEHLGFGSIDLTSGVFTLVGSTGTQLEGLGESGGNVYGMSAAGELELVDTTNGGLTGIGASGVSIHDFGSTLSGLFARGTDGNLYSINAGTGAATLLGAVGTIPVTGRTQLSTGSSTLFYIAVNGPSTLYTLSTSTGAPTQVGPTGGPTGNALVWDGGSSSLYMGGQSGVFIGLYTLSTSTGAATQGAALTGTSFAFMGLAPILTPEPVSGALACAGLLVLLGRRYAIPRRGRR